MRQRFLTSLATAALAFASACSGASNQAQNSSRLVGTWEDDLSRGPQFCTFGAGERDEHPSSLVRYARETNAPIRLTISADGNYVMEGPVVDEDVRVEYTWSLVSDIGDRVTIHIHDPEQPTETMTYAFVEPDLIRDGDRPTGDLYLRRVK